MPKVLSPAQIGDFRERLIDAAERQSSELGAHAVSLRQLAAELGVSAMTPYRYFRDKDDILAAVRARGFDRFAQALETAAETEADLSARAHAAATAYVRFAFEQPAAYRLMFELTQPNEAEYPELVRACDRARATMTAHIRPMIEAGRLGGDPIVVAHAIWAALHGLVVLKLAGKLGPETDFESIRLAMLAALTRGFGVTSVQGAKDAAAF